MKPIADVVNAISGVINGVTLPAREKKELQAEILRLVYEREREMIEARAGVISRGCRELATAFVAAIGDVDICCYRTYRHFHEFAHVVGYFPVLGFAGDRVGRVRGGEEWGKNGGGHF